MTDPATAVEMFEVRVEHDPDAPLLLTADGVGRTYRQLAARADALAGELRRRGAETGDVVGLYLWNDPAWVVAVLASWWCGCSFAACGALTPPAEARRRFELVRPRVIVAAEGTDLGG